MNRRYLLISALWTVVFATSSCSTNAARSGLASSDRTEEVVLDRLYFGRAVPAGGEVSEDDWRTFLADVVTPRFPAGLTVLRSEGQWRDAKGVVIKEAGFVLELMHPGGLANDTTVRAIMREYRTRFGQEAVLRIQTRARMEFESAGGT